MASNIYTFENLEGRFNHSQGRSAPPTSFPVGADFYDDDEDDIDDFSSDGPPFSQMAAPQTQSFGGRGPTMTPWARAGGGGQQMMSSSFPIGRGGPMSTPQRFPASGFPPSRPSAPSSFSLPVRPDRHLPSSSSYTQRLPIAPDPRTFARPAVQQQRLPVGPPPPPAPMQRQSYQPQQRQPVASGSRTYPSHPSRSYEDEDEYDSEFEEGIDLMEVDDSVLDANNYGYSSHPQRQRYDSSRDETFAGQPSYNYGPSPPRSAPNHAPPRQTGQRARQRPNDNCVRVSSLPDRYRSLFKFPFFNKVQSQCFEAAMRTDENLVVSAPTGSGKTVLFELAIIRLLETGNNLKAVYIAPTKALCSERATDWKMKFSGLGVRCLELTGDTDWGTGSFKEIEQARLVVTTPEKWDSLTRWKHPSQGNARFLNEISLFLIDEVHILREKRGSSLEVIVSRMKSFDRSIRFVALSATVPNIDDVGRWLRPEEGFHSSDTASFEISQLGSAKVFSFGDEFRPCQLKRVIVPYPFKPGSNAFKNVKTYEFKVYNLLVEHGVGKPALIFAPTRNGTVSCAEQLVKEYQAAAERKERLPWKNTTKVLVPFSDSKLQALVQYGVAFHHGGLSLEDRRNVESAFLNGGIKMICCTSVSITLAVGVNLPAHTVVILGTKMFAGGPGGMVDYPDLDIIQMIGRAGRPQFDSEGLAIIMTEAGQEHRFDAITGGGTILESSLHENLTEHLNSEIALHTISSLDKAQRWLKDSFLYVRVLQNPRFYSKQLGDAARSALSPAQALERFVADAVKSLRETGLINTPGAGEDDGDDREVRSLVATPSGDVMSKNCIKYSTMRRLMKIPDKPTLRELLEILCEADEFDEARLRVSEKVNLRKLGQDQAIRFPTKEVKTTKDKIFVLIQANCGGIPLGDLKTDHQQGLELVVIFRHAVRIAKSILDLGLERTNGYIVKYGLEILRAMNAKAWEGRGSVLFRQLDKLGDKAIKTFANNNIKTFEDLGSDPHRIERLLGRNPPFGAQLCAQIKALPVFTLAVTEKSVETDGGKSPVAVELECTLSVVVGKQFKLKGYRTMVTVSALVITSDMALVDFRKTNIKFLTTKPQTYTVTAMLTKPSEHVNVYLTCNEVVGVGTFATYHPPDLPMSDYPVPDLRPRAQSILRPIGQAMDVDEQPQREPVRPSKRDVEEVDELEDENQVDRAAAAKKKRGPKPVDIDQPAVLLENGKWQCNHQCKDKTKCSHLCCREGMDHPPKKIIRTNSKESATEGEPRPKSPVKNARADPRPSTSRPTGLDGFKKASTVFGKVANVTTKSVEPGKKKLAPKMVIDSDDDELPEGDAMFGYGSHQPDVIFRRHNKNGSDSSTVYGDDEVDAFIAGFGDEKSLVSSAQKRQRAAREGSGTKRAERERTPDFPTWKTSDNEDEDEDEPAVPAKRDDYEDILSSSPEAHPATQPSKVQQPPPVPTQPSRRAPKQQPRPLQPQISHNIAPAAAAGPTAVKSEPPAPAPKPAPQVPAWGFPKPAASSSAFGSSSPPSSAWKKTSTSAGFGVGKSRPGPRASMNAPPPPPRTGFFKPTLRKEEKEEKLFRPMTSEEGSSPPPMRARGKETMVANASSSPPRQSNSIRASQPAAPAPAAPPPAPALVAEESSSEDEEDDTLTYLLNGGVKIEG